MGVKWAVIIFVGCTGPQILAEPFKFFRCVVNGGGNFLVYGKGRGPGGGGSGCNTKIYI